MVSLFIEALTGEFRVKELVLDMLFPPGTCRSILVGIGKGDGVADSGF